MKLAVLTCVCGAAAFFWRALRVHTVPGTPPMLPGALNQSDAWVSKYLRPLPPEGPLDVRLQARLPWRPEDVSRLDAWLQRHRARVHTFSAFCRRPCQKPAVDWVCFTFMHG